MSTAPRVLAVCVNWNGGTVLGDTLSSLEACRYPGLEVLVVDNASSDGSQQLVKSPARLLQLSSNLGYAAALNRAFEPYLTGAVEAPDYFLILNNDVEVEPGMIEYLVGFAGREGPGVYGPQVRLKSDPIRLEAAWGEVAWNHVLARFKGQGESCSEWSQPSRVQLLLGCALLLHSEVLLATGKWDEHFFMYHEEVDYLYRVERLGFPVFFCPGSWVLHRGGFSTRRQPHQKTYWLRRNTIYFFRKHGAGWHHWFTLAASLAGSVGLNLVTFRWIRLGAIVRGVVDGFRNRVHR